MSINATTQIVYDGTRNAIIKCIGICDGTDGNEANVVKVDVSELMPAGGRVKIKRIQYDVSYGVVQLSWDAAPPVPIDYLDGEGERDYCSVDGLLNPVDETGYGDILLSTLGFELNSTYSLIIHLLKKPK
jgi:hypothetical protein